MSLKKYLSEAAFRKSQPVTGDEINISINGITNVKATVVEHINGAITVQVSSKAAKLLENYSAPVEAAFDDEEDEEEYMPAAGDVVRIDHPSDHNGHLGEVAEVAPSGNFAYVEFKDGSVESYHSSDLIKVTDEEAYAYFDDESDYEDDGFDEGINDIRRLSGMKEASGYDTSPGSPFDRGKADAYYGRRGNPTKVIDKPNATVRGERMIVQLTDPAEIKAYYAGYEGSEFGEKDYGTFPDTNDDVEEGFAGWNTHASPANAEKATLKNVIVTSPSGKTYTFDTEEDARRLFLDKWHVVKNPSSGWMVDVSGTRNNEGAENWNANVSSIPRTEPFALKKIVVKSKLGKTYTFDNEQEAKQHFGKNWAKIADPTWRKSNGWKLNTNNSKPALETSQKMFDKMKDNDLYAYRRAAKAEHKAEMEKLKAEKEKSGKVNEAGQMNAQAALKILRDLGTGANEYEPIYKKDRSTMGGFANKMINELYPVIDYLRTLPNSQEPIEMLADIRARAKQIEVSPDKTMLGPLMNHASGTLFQVGQWIKANVNESLSVYVKESSGKIKKVNLKEGIKRINNTWSCNVWTKKAR